MITYVFVELGEVIKIQVRVFMLKLSVTFGFMLMRFVDVAVVVFAFVPSVLCEN